MKCYPGIKMTRRKYIALKRKQLKEVKKAMTSLMIGCAIREIWGSAFFVNRINSIFTEISAIDKYLKGGE